MIFFGFLLAATLAARLAGFLGVRVLTDWSACMRWGLAAALVFFGTDHLLTTERYLPMLPSFVPAPALVVVFTGLCEIAGAIGLLVPRLRRLAGIMLAIYFVCVFPANIKNAIDGLNVEGLPQAGWYYWVRLLFQPVAVWWSLRAAEVIGGASRQAAAKPASSASTI